MRLINSILVASALNAIAVFGHPGHDSKHEAQERAEYFASVPKHQRSLAQCQENLKARGHTARAIQRRKAQVNRLHESRSLHKRSLKQIRDLDSVLATDHASNLTGITVDVDPSVLFSNNRTCLLTPETTQGPYWVDGELVRQNVTETQAGVPLTVSLEIYDVNTCEPLPSVLLEWWHCNATGVYSGIVANGNGDSSDLSNLDATFLRGIQQSDDAGIATFESIFPGHYTGRTTHVHVLAHMNATVRANGTIEGGYISHVGQIFFDQSLISQVESVAPYSGNTQTLTTNAEDNILSGEAADVDPVVDYVLLGDTVEQGIFAWISFGLNSLATYDVSSAATLTEEGGVANENSGFGGPGGNGTMPTGAPPSGVPTGAAPTGV